MRETAARQLFGHHGIRGVQMRKVVEKSRSRLCREETLPVLLTPEQCQELTFLMVEVGPRAYGCVQQLCITRQRFDVGADFENPMRWKSSLFFRGRNPEAAYESGKIRVIETEPVKRQNVLPCS